MNIQIDYLRKKNALTYMLLHYQARCQQYLHMDMPVNDIQTLYDFEMEYVARYEKELQLLEEITWN